MKLGDLIIAVLLGLILTVAIHFQFGNHEDLAMKNCVKTSMNDEQLAKCIRNIK